MNINKVVKRFKRNIKGNVTYENVEKYIKGKGYTIILFDDNTDEIHTFCLEKTAKEHLAFTYINNVNIIFIRRTCMEYQKLQLLLHEIGHIELNHFNCYAPNSDEKEYQANEFAHLASDKKHFRFVKIFFAVLLVISVASNIYLLIAHVQYSASTNIESQRVITAVKEPAEYYVTKSGQKYHRSSCKYAKTAYPVDEETAKVFYSPCSHCNP